jgi:hypothetical protein
MSQTEMARADFQDDHEHSRGKSDGEKKPKSRRPASTYTILEHYARKHNCLQALLLIHYDVTRYRISATTSQSLAVSA